jgi:hypothetical protein
MKFLRSLAASRGTSPSRAIALLPSRFASDGPLRGTPAHARGDDRTADEEVPIALDPISAPAEVKSVPAQLRTHVVRQADLAAPRPFDVEQLLSNHAVSVTKVERSTEAEPRPLKPASGRPLHDAHAESSEPAKLAGMELRRFNPGAANTDQVSPLSAAIVAQRTLQSRDENQVVHVTIGRIDVVANAAPAPAQRRNATPRQATVTLSDYLRGESAGRR